MSMEIPKATDTLEDPMKRVTAFGEGILFSSGFIRYFP
jgi:hypothetical protein